MVSYILRNVLIGVSIFYCFDNVCVDMVNIGEVGVCGKFDIGLIKYNLVVFGLVF